MTDPSKSRIDLDKLADFHKPISEPLNFWVTEPSKKLWLDYAVKTGKIPEEEGYQPPESGYVPLRILKKEPKVIKPYVRKAPVKKTPPPKPVARKVPVKRSQSAPATEKSNPKASISAWFTPKSTTDK